MLIDAENQKIVGSILDQYGWPDKTDFGSTGPGETVWGRNTARRRGVSKKYFGLVRIAAEKGDADKRSLALLQDRMLTGEGNKQLYGRRYSLSKT